MIRNSASSALIVTLVVFCGCGEDESDSNDGDTADAGTTMSSGGSDNDGSDNGGSDNGGSDNGGSDNGGSDNGGSDNGGSDNGGSDNGGSDNGSGGDAGGDGMGGNSNGTANTTEGNTQSNTANSTSGGPVAGEWVSPLGDLVGRPFHCAIDYMSEKPDEDVIIAGATNMGLFETHDQGATWTALGTDPDSAEVVNGPMSIIYDPDDPEVFWEAGIYGPSPFKTEDGGNTFVQLGNIDHTDLISIDFTDPERKLLLAGAHEGTPVLHKSTDSGQNWTNIYGNLPSGCAFASYPHILDADTFLLGCWTSIARSTDAGTNWSFVTEGSGAAAPLIASDGTIYWQVNFGTELYRSKDDGETWDVIPVPEGHFARSTAPIELPDGRLALAGREAVLVSTADGGWVKASPNYPAMPSLPIGIMYAKRQKAFYIWGHACDEIVDGNEAYRYDFDYETF